MASVLGVVLPESITVPAGATSANFCFTLDGAYDPHQVFDITATMAGSSATTYAAESYVAPFAVHSANPTTTTPDLCGTRHATRAL